MEELLKLIDTLKAKYNLVDVIFDTECINDFGDLSFLIKSILETSFPDCQFIISENISEDNQHYVVTIKYGEVEHLIKTDATSDWLSDECLSEIEILPKSLKLDKTYYSINPAIGLTGQEVWLFAGTDDNLKSARKEGLPIIYPGENIFETEEFKKYNL